MVNDRDALVRVMIGMAARVRVMDVRRMVGVRVAAKIGIRFRLSIGLRKHDVSR